MSVHTLTSFDGLVRDMYPLPGTQIKQWIVDQRREAAWQRETCPLVSTETHDDNTGVPCHNSYGAQWFLLEGHDCCGDCNDLAEATRDRPDVAAWLKLKAERPAMTRIIILGGPKTGKTTLAYDMGGGRYGSTTVHHTDDFIHLGWSAASQHIVDEWLPLPGPWIIEGVAAVRALRKWRDQHPGEPPPVDKVIYLREPHVPLTAGQRAMAKGVETVWQEIAGWLLGEGVAMDDATLDAVAV